jgi:hypothetical protein
LVQVALAWLLMNPVVSVPIVGPTKRHHVPDAVAALDIALTDDEVRAVEEPYTLREPPASNDEGLKTPPFDSVISVVAPGPRSRSWAALSGIMRVPQAGIRLMAEGGWDVELALDGWAGRCDGRDHHVHRRWRR